MEPIFESYQEYENEFKLKTLNIKEMPLFLQENVNKYKEWLDFD